MTTPAVPVSSAMPDEANAPAPDRFAGVRAYADAILGACRAAHGGPRGCVDADCQRARAMREMLAALDARPGGGAVGAPLAPGRRAEMERRYRLARSVDTAAMPEGQERALAQWATAYGGELLAALDAAEAEIRTKERARETAWNTVAARDEALVAAEARYADALARKEAYVQEAEAARADAERQADEFRRDRDHYKREADVQSNYRQEAERERDRLAADALAALSRVAATPERGYGAEPHCLGADIERLGRERDEARALFAHESEAATRLAGEADALRAAAGVPPGAPPEQAVAHVAGLRETLARQEGDIANLVRVGTRHGWNGVENSKILWQFFDDALTAAEARAGRLAAILDRYARHGDGCNGMFSAYPCVCGLRAALAAEGGDARPPAAAADTPTTPEA